jgi:hypothetical protein
MSTTDTERAAYITGLRALADLLETHDDLLLPYTGGRYAAMNVIPARDDQRAQVAAWARALPGKVGKAPRGDSYFDLTGTIGGIAICVIADRDEVCERVVTGTREVEQEEVVTPATTRTVTATEEVVEWRCAPILSSVTA